MLLIVVRVLLAVLMVLASVSSDGSRGVVRGGDDDDDDGNGAVCVVGVVCIPVYLNILLTERERPHSTWSTSSFRSALIRITRCFRSQVYLAALTLIIGSLLNYGSARAQWCMILDHGTLRLL